MASEVRIEKDVRGWIRRRARRAARNRSAFLLAAVLLAAVPARAGERYSFWVEKKDGMIDHTIRGRVVTDGANYRAELDPAPAGVYVPALLVSADGGSHEYDVDPEKRTYYERGSKAGPEGPTFTQLMLTMMALQGEPAADEVELTLQSADSLAAAPEGRGQARRHELRLAYRVTMRLHGERIRGRVEVQAVYWMAEDRRLGMPRPLRPELVTTFPEVDRQIAAALSVLRGAPLYQELTVRARIGSNDEQVVTLKKAIENIEPAPTGPELFQVPAGFRYEEPEISAPGG